MAHIIEHQDGYKIEVITSGPKPSDLDTYIETREDIDGVLWMPGKLSSSQQPEGRMSGTEVEGEAMTSAMEKIMGDYVTKLAADSLDLSDIDLDIEF